MTSALPKAVRRGLAAQAADLVRDAILAGHFPPGSPLREVDLAARLDISRGSVREGLTALESEGLIRTGWHRATTVIEVTDADVEEVYALRGALDRLAGTTLQKRSAVEALDQLDALVNEMGTEVETTTDYRRLVALDLDFHDCIYVAAGNERLLSAWRSIRSQVHLFQLRRVESGYGHYRARVVAEHRELVALLRGTDADALARAAAEHVDSARRSLLADLRSEAAAREGSLPSAGRQPGQ